MRDYTQNELEERYQKLPKPLKDALFDPEVAYQIFDTGKKFGMSIEQIGEIADEVGYVILGITLPAEFIANLKARLGIGDDSAREMASEINHTVFASLRTLLQETHHVEMTDRELMSQSQNAASPPEVPIAQPTTPNPKKDFPPVSAASIPTPAKPQPKAPPQQQTGNNKEELPSWVTKELETPKNTFEKSLTPEPESPDTKPALSIEKQSSDITTTAPKPERPIPSWVREQEERKAQKTQNPPITQNPKTAPPSENKSKEEPIRQTPARFTLDLRNKKAEPVKDKPKISPPTPDKELPKNAPTRLPAVPVELENILKEMKEANKPAGLAAEKIQAPPPIEQTDEKLLSKPAEPHPPQGEARNTEETSTSASAALEPEPKELKIPPSSVTPPPAVQKPTYGERNKVDPYRENIEG